MSKYIPGNQKHLTLADRKYIEKSLNEGVTFKDIAKYLCKDPTTISKEVKLHRLDEWYRPGPFYNAKNFCVKRYHCHKTNACSKIVLCGVKCASCPTCNRTCPDFEKEICTRLDKAPFVCNGCPKAISRCTIVHKYRYDAVFAERKYKECLSSSRVGINMTKQELHKKDMVITPLVYQGQSPYQIVTNHPELGMSVRTLYSYLDSGILTARNIDLKRKVKFKPRKVHKTQINDRGVFRGRMYTDFQALGLEYFAEMDTVHSSRGSKKVILTFFLTREKLFLAFIMNRCTPGAVKLIFDKLEHQLGSYDFLSLFSTILTDRGCEFADPASLETNSEGFERSSIYYCDPMRSGQKGGIEQAHTMLRMVLPKGTGFEYLTQWDLRTIVDNINSTPREILRGRTPYEVALENYGPDILKALQLRPVAPDEVNLTPKLIRFTH